MNTELMVFILGSVVICAMALGAGALFLFGNRLHEWSDNRKFPIKYKGTLLTSNIEPPMCTKDDLVNALQLCISAVLTTHGYDVEKMHDLLDTTKLLWIPSSEEKPGAVKEGGQWLTGWTSGATIAVVYTKAQLLVETAFVHEILHRLHTIADIVDYDHLDSRMWEGPESAQALVKQNLISERVVS